MKRKLDYMKLSQDATNEIWSVTMRREYCSPTQKKRAVEKVIRSSIEAALDVPSTVDGWEEGVDPVTRNPSPVPEKNPYGGMVSVADLLQLEAQLLSDAECPRLADGYRAACNHIHNQVRMLILQAQETSHDC